MKKYDVAIIGAGPSGMMAAIAASGNGKRVALIERNPQLGRKLLATGNGRCNLTNSCVTIDRYHGANMEFIETVLGSFDQHATLSFFEDLGLVLKEESNGRIFPRTNQASSVVEVLRQRLFRNNVHVLLDAQVVEIENPLLWKISLSSGKTLQSDKLIIATGGKAAHYMGSTGDGLYWAKKLGHSFTLTHAALVPIETVEQWPKDIQGIKVDACVWSTSDNKTIGKSAGDLLFTSYGVSGPAVMALAGNIAPLLKTSQVLLHIDLFPDINEDQLDRLIIRIFESDARKALRDALIGLLPSGMIPLIIKLAGLAEHTQVTSIQKNERLDIVRTLKDITLTVSKLRPYKEAQVTAGGVNSDEIDPLSLESKLVKGLHFAGEVLDAYGDSGGFNLQWAWSSGYVAGNFI
ncbi:MAG: BaiN/RdsA family NAD(P)/FAD-dependent oxidoreductase [Armatimonadota bacterium]